MISLFLTLFAFGSMIFIHELGHYLAAIKVGIRVEKFYLGFDFWGLKLFKYNYKGTEYGIGVFPLGGYVKMAGQEDFGKANIDGADDEFTSKTVWERIQVLAAGVVFNFISAFVFSGLALSLGYRLVSPEIGVVEPGSAAWRAGLKAGDVITAYGPVPITSFDSLSTEVALGGAEDRKKIKFIRDGREELLFVKPDMGMLDIPSLGVGPARSRQVHGVVENLPAEKAGVLPGDKIVKVEGQVLEQWDDLSPWVQKLAEEKLAKKLAPEVVITVDRAGEMIDLSIPMVRQKRSMLGIRPVLGRQVREVLPDSVLQRAGIEKGMVLESVNGKPFDDVVLFNGIESIESLSFKGLGKVVDVPFDGDAEALLAALYFGDVSELKEIKIAQVVEGSSAEKIGVQKGDLLLSIQVGDVVTNKPDWMSLTRAVSDKEEEPLVVKVQRGDQVLTLEGTLTQMEADRYVLGMIPDRKLAEVSLGTAMLWPFHMLRQTYKGMLSLVTGKIPAKHISGPVGILKVTYQVAETGLAQLVYLMALLSINLAFLNILPLPVLDGGHLLFCVIEWIKGSPVSEVVMQKAQMFGMLLLLSLFLFATWNDFTQNI